MRSAHRESLAKEGEWLTSRSHGLRSWSNMMSNPRSSKHSEGGQQHGAAGFAVPGGTWSYDSVVHVAGVGELGEQEDDEQEAKECAAEREVW